MTDLDRAVLEEVVDRGRDLVGEGLVIGTSGNISVRVPGGLVISPSSISYEEIEVDDLCLLDDGGAQVDGRGRPSSETPMHLAIYAATGAGAIVHTHSPAAVAISTVVDHLPAIHYGITQLGGTTIRIAGYERFGSAALAGTAAAAIEGRHAVILRNHGTIACGDTVAAAFHRARLLEWLCDVYWRALQVGSPTILSDDELAEVVAEARRRSYGT